MFEQWNVTSIIRTKTRIWRTFTINLSRVFINFLINNSLKITYLNIAKFFINNFLTASVTEFYLIFFTDHVAHKINF